MSSDDTMLTLTIHLNVYIRTPDGVRSSAGTHIIWFV